MKQLWEVAPNLKDQTHTKVHEDSAVTKRKLWEWIADQHDRYGYRFVPLAERDHGLLVSLRILFLRPGAPGAILRRSDIDNRLKTLFDALRMPGQPSELGSYLEPRPGEDPFFVLLEDDNLITEVSVETDTLLAPNSWANGRYLDSDARLVITADLRPAYTQPLNKMFG